jgi:hypothetical protein
METKQIITQFSELVKIDSAEKFWELIKQENKEKKWSVTPVKIEFRDGKIIENSEQVKKLVELMQNWAENELKIDDVGTIDKDTTIVRTVFEWFSGSRKQVTKGFDEIKKNFTTIETDIKNIGLAFKQRKEELLEKEYQNREAAILAELKMELHSIKEEYGVEISANLFSDFIAQKRKTKVLTDTGKLTKKIRDEIKAKVREILEPILKEREAQRLKEQDLQKLTLDLQDININALFIDELENSKTKLQQLLNTAEMRYPNAVQEAESQIKANIRLVEANIARLKAEQEKEVLKKAEEERKAAELKKQEEIKARAEAIQEAQMQQKEKMQEAKKTKYKIPLEEIEVIAAVEFEAESEEEAKQKAIEMFKQQLDMIELNKIKG